MSDLDELLSISDVTCGQCSLVVEQVGVTESLEQAWSFLPDRGQGVVVLADRIERFSPGERSGLLVEAEVTVGDETLVLRMDGGRSWRAWRWMERPGESHLYVERDYLSSEPRAAGSLLKYRQYWSKVPGADDIQVWRPMGARFCGFMEGGR